MINKDSLSVIGGGTAGFATSVFGTQTEFLHLVVYSIIGGCVGWITKEILEYFKNRKNEKIK